MLTWLWYFLFTQTVEIPIYAFALRGRVGVAFAASAITHPVVWLLFPAIIDEWIPMVIAAELFAVTIEALWLRAFGLRRALLWSALANGASFGLGLLCHELFGIP